MSNRLQVLYRLQSKLYIEGSPVFIEAGVLLKDTKTNRITVQIKLCNLDSKKIIACKISIKAFELNGNEVEGIPSYPYLDICVKQGQTFGSLVPIFIPDVSARKFSVSVIEVIFDDETVWSYAPCDWEPILDQVTIVEYFADPELKKQYELEVGADGKYVPVIRDSLFLCTCGTVNLSTSTHCYKCRRDFDFLIKNIDVEYLTAKKEARFQKESDEREALEQKKKEAEEKARIVSELRKTKTKKLIKIFLSIVIVMAIIAALIPTVIMPAIEIPSMYQRAYALLEDGLYDEASQMFETLGDYKDASNMVLEAQYQKADSLAASKDYQSAINVWTSLADYSDSQERIIIAETEWKEMNYQIALNLMEEEKYDKASNAFKAISGYKDSDLKYAESLELKRETDYQTAVTAAKNGDYSVAVKYFGLVGDYKDAIEKGTDANYNYACQLLSQREYLAAVSRFEKCLDYKDSSSKILDAKYGYVKLNERHADDLAKSYLTELLSIDYPGAEVLYKQVCVWRVDVFAVNNSEKSTVNMSSIDPYDDLYFHFRVSGGEHGETMTLTIKVNLPGDPWSPISVPGVKDGFTSYIGCTKHSKLPRGVATVDFYDDAGRFIGKGSILIKP